jgi:hypothetical protein
MSSLRAAEQRRADFKETRQYLAEPELWREQAAGDTAPKPQCKSDFSLIK